MQDYTLKAKKVLLKQEKKSEINAVEFGHQNHWIDAIKDGYGSDKHRSLTSNFDFAGPLSEVVLLGNVAIRSSYIRRST